MKIKEQLQSGVNHATGLSRNFVEKLWYPWVANNSIARSSLAMLFLIILCIGAFVSTRLLDSSGFTILQSITGNDPKKSIFASIISTKRPRENYQENKPGNGIPLNCNITTCPRNNYPSNHSIPTRDQRPHPSPTCPNYFRWIHEDLWPWRDSGISKEMVEMARAMTSADFRLVIVNGTAYLETYKRSFQTRDIFTQWGIVQLLRLYPGRIPDLDLIFGCGDRPSVVKEAKTPPPPLFSYDGDESTSDIVFPDWSFWGWPEINIKPWETLSGELKQGNERMKWRNREPQAYWKGNPHVSSIRMDLLKCNVSPQQDWNARIYAQDWIRERRSGFKNSDLASQCKHRFKIYIEGIGWSVSEKYILACDSVTLLVKPRYYDFFTRNLMPLQHYWPIRDDKKCSSIKHAVDWGNTHQQEAQAIGKAASKFIQEELRMNHVYDYMFHLLSEYASLLTYKPTVPPKAVEICSESMACPAKGLMRKYMMESAVAGPSDVPPCTMPPPYVPAALHSLLERKRSNIKQVEMWEKEYWDRHSS